MKKYKSVYGEAEVPVPSSDRLLKASNISYIELTVGLTEIGRELIGKNLEPLGSVQAFSIDKPHAVPGGHGGLVGSWGRRFYSESPRVLGGQLYAKNYIVS